MSRPHDDEHDPTQERVRALLADLGSAGSRPPGPVPDDVAARLDATLADLAGLADTTTDPRAAARRRRSPRLLVAAAVVLLVGAGGVTTTQLVTGGGADESASGGSSAASEADPDTGPDSGTDTGTAPESTGGDADRRATGAPPELTRAGFDAEVAALVAVPTEPDVRDSAVTETGCTRPPGRGTVRPVRLDGRPATLVTRPARDGDRLAEAWACDASRVLASTRVATSPD